MSTHTKEPVGRARQWLNKILNKKVKRYIFLTSLWSFFKNQDTIDNHTLNKLNSVMMLGASEGSLVIPALLGRVIWKDSMGNIVKEVEFQQEVVAMQSHELVVQHALNNVPDYLNYDKREVIEKDIHKLLTSMVG